ncbi:MAG: hypothetical protein M3041_02335 [Acidobacteriota bacterium]|nr:hypothetical protein [Acidobacteriota bacterium]
MRVKQEELQPGCFWALAAGWAALTWAFPDTGVLAREKFWLNVAVVIAIVLIGIFATIERKTVGDSTLVVDGFPQPGQVFRGKIETKLNNERTSRFKLRLQVGRPSRRRSSPTWISDAIAHPTHGEKGLTLPFEFSIPAGIDAENTAWSLVVRSWSPPMPYLATFILPRTPHEQ